MIIKKLLNFLGSCLIFIRYANKKDPFLLFSKITKNVKIVRDDKKKTVIFAPIRVSPVSNLFEGLLSYYFRLKGYKVSALMCDQAVTYCENLSKNESHKELKCALCKKEQDRFCKIFKVKNISVKKELTKSKRSEINDLIDNRDFDKDEDFVFKGINLKEDIIAGTMRYTLKSSIDNDLSLVKEFAKTAFYFSSAFSSIQDKEKNDLLILSHGIYSSWGSVLTTSQTLGLDSIVWGRGYFGQGSILFGHNKNYHEDFIHEENSLWENEKLNDKQRNKVLSYFSEKTNKFNGNDYVNYYKDLKSIDFNVKKFWSKLDKYEKKYGMYSNIPWDGQVFNKTKEFPTTAIYVKTTIDWFIENNDCCLIIRSHPAEITGSGSKYTETFEELLKEIYSVLPENIFFLKPDNPISSYDLVQKVDASILYGSTLSLEFAVLGYSVIQTGTFNTSNKGIVFEADNKKLFYKYLKRVKTEDLIMTDKMKDRALLYAYYWIYKRHVEDTTQSLKKLQFQNFLFNDIREFENNKTLKLVFNRIINKQKILNEDYISK